MKNGWRKLAAMVIALMLAVMLPVIVMAEETDEIQQDVEAMADAADVTGEDQEADLAPVESGESSDGTSLTLGCGFGVDDSALTEEQKTVREEAVNLYYGVEDGALADLVAAGSAAQADVDAYTQGRNARWTLAIMDTSGWTDDQLRAYNAAAEAKGDERAAAIEALVQSGQLTDEQGDALKIAATNTSRSVNLTAEDNAVYETAQATLKEARQVLKQTLTDAEISIKEGSSERTKSKGDMEPEQSREKTNKT